MFEIEKHSYQKDLPTSHLDALVYHHQNRINYHQMMMAEAIAELALRGEVATELYYDGDGNEHQ